MLHALYVLHTVGNGERVYETGLVALKYRVTFRDKPILIPSVLC